MTASCFSSVFVWDGFYNYCPNLLFMECFFCYELLHSSSRFSSSLLCHQGLLHNRFSHYIINFHERLNLICGKGPCIVKYDRLWWSKTESDFLIQKLQDIIQYTIIYSARCCPLGWMFNSNEKMLFHSWISRKGSYKLDWKYVEESRQTETYRFPVFWNVLNVLAIRAAAKYSYTLETTPGHEYLSFIHCQVDSKFQWLM